MIRIHGLFLAALIAISVETSQQHENDDSLDYNGRDPRFSFGLGKRAAAPRHRSDVAKLLATIKGWGYAGPHGLFKRSSVSSLRQLLDSMRTHIFKRSPGPQEEELSGADLAELRELEELLEELCRGGLESWDIKRGAERLEALEAGEEQEQEEQEGRSKRSIAELDGKKPYGFGLGKRTKTYGFGLGKRAAYGYGLGKKRAFPYGAYGLGWGKRNISPNDLVKGKRSVSPYDLGWGKRSVSPYDLGWGKRSVSPYDLGWGKRSAYGLQVLMPGLGLGKRESYSNRESYGKRAPYGFGLGK